MRNHFKYFSVLTATDCLVVALESPGRPLDWLAASASISIRSNAFGLGREVSGSTKVRNISVTPSRCQLERSKIDTGSKLTSVDSSEPQCTPPAQAFS